MGMELDVGLPRAYRISEMPRDSGGRSADDGPQRRAGDPGRAQRAAALTAAYHGGLGQTVAFGWVRTAPGQPVRVVVAGDALTGSTGSAGGEVLLALPSGARGVPLAPGELSALLARLRCWRAVAGISDGLGGADGHRVSGRAADGGPQGDPTGVLALDEAVLGSWTGPFGWLVIAEPLTPERLRSLAEEAGLRLRLAAGSADRFPERAALAERMKGRHAEFQHGVSAGFWRIRVAAGGADEASAARVAGLLCAAADLGGLPYALTPGTSASGGRASAASSMVDP